MFLAVLIATVAAPPTLGGWVVFWNSDSPARFIERADRFAEVLPEWFTMTEAGDVVRASPEHAVRRAELLRTARKHQVRVLGMATNYGPNGFDPARMTKMLQDPAVRARHIATLVRFAKADGLNGVDLDYESMRAEDRAAFSGFVRELGTAMRRAKLHLSVTVHPKDAEPGNWDGPKAQDWAAIGRAADSVRVVAYDFSWADSEPGPIAPDDWVRRVMTFAKTVIPAAKLRLGVPAYGYDWSTKPARSLTYGDFLSLDPANRDASTIDAANGERIVGKARFSGREAMRRKLALAESLGIPGISFWYVGSEDPEFWTP
ncbi:MAG: glycosyl hydrolase family 18 protein [Fimbriimonadaceae bacterium]|nr:glycosyl hydrolase family 18 protein [Fimbriimonadaceae bacterium]